MSTLTIVGLGPGPLALITKEAEDCLLQADKIFFRTSAYPAYAWLEGLGKDLASFDGLYTMAWPGTDEMYEFMATALLKEAGLRGSATYALPGSPSILEDTTRILRRRAREAGVEIRIVEGLSFIEPALAAIDFDFALGLQIVLPWTHIETRKTSSHIAMLICQVDTRKQPTEPPRIDRTVGWLRATYPADHPVTLIWPSGLPAFETLHLKVPLAGLVEAYGAGKLFASLFVPPLPSLEK